jgi:predicted lipoprotein with Yx(FWY)xxD motif
MKRFQRLASLAVAAVMLLAAGPALADHHAIKVAKKDGIGSFLTDAKGMTLYTFKNDMPGMSHCEGGCVENWPIYFAERVDAKEGVAAKDFATITRADGKKQTTYKGMPLYYYHDDKAAGDTSGQGKRDVWYVAAP